MWTIKGNTQIVDLVFPSDNKTLSYAICKQTTKKIKKEKLFEFLCLFDVFVFLELSSFQRTYLLLLFKGVIFLANKQNLRSKLY